MGKSKNVIDYRVRRKFNLIQVCGAKCNLCGYDKLQDALDFHHINPDEKEYSISQNGRCHDIKKDLNEVKKCILVCANCHREIHAGMHAEEELLEKKIYDEKKAQQLINAKEYLMTKTIYHCKKCGKELSNKNKSMLCEKCYKESISQHIPSKNELKELLKQFNFCEIGRKYGVSDNTIRKWCKKYGLPYKSTEIKKIKNWDNI